MKILAIETSCDETSIAVVEDGHRVLSLITNTQIEYFAKVGGVIPEDSARLHVENIDIVYNEALKQADVTISDIDYIAVTGGPGLMGSLLVGVSFAKTLALKYNKRLIAVNHLQAHIAALNLEHELKFPLITLIVSGGHTELVYVKDFNTYKKIGQTLDDAAGESFDKVARILDLGYPGGPKIDILAATGQDNYQFPLPKNDQSLDFSFSGLKSAAFNLNNQLQMKNIEINKADFANSFQTTVVEILIKKLKMAVKLYPEATIAIVGGVSANSQLKKEADETFSEVLIPSLQYCTDNAAMIGARAFFQLESVSSMDLNAKSNLSVEDNL